MAIEDWIDDYYFDDDDDAGPPPVKCRHCGSTEVYLGRDDSGTWALYGLNSRKHRCNPKRLAEYRSDAFEDLP